MLMVTHYIYVKIEKFLAYIFFKIIKNEYKNCKNNSDKSFIN